MAKLPTLIPLINCPADSKFGHFRLLSHTGGDYDPRKWQANEGKGSYPNLDPNFWTTSYINQGAPSVYTTEWFEDPVWEGTLTVIECLDGAYYRVEIDTGDGKPVITGLMACSTFLTVLPTMSVGKAEGKWSATWKSKRYLIVPA